MPVDRKTVSSLLDNLPAIYQEDRRGGDSNFLGRFLLAFEWVLLGRGEPAEKVSDYGLEEIIDGLQRYFESGFPKAGILPELQSAPSDALQWLAGWLSLTLRDDWDDKQKREFIAKASYFYKLRGTLRGIREFLSICMQFGVDINEYNASFQIGVHSRVGVDASLDGGKPFFFHVTIVLPDVDTVLRQRCLDAATDVIDLQKPAHTYYTVDIVTPTFQISVHSQVGVDTLLG